MSPRDDEHREALAEALATLVDAPHAERSRLFERFASDQPALRDELGSLLAAYDRDPAFLEAPSTGASLPGAEESADDPCLAAGVSMDGYVVLRRIGSGGMGTVYLAVRAQAEFRSRVALKVLKRGLDSAELLARFRRERRILASLDHPHIAKLLDGGMTPDGRPYFAMEYIEGQPLDAYCRERDLPVAARIALFEQVCAATEHAHRNLVVHRDLKPSNVLVTEGRVKLLDFGVAKILDATDGTGAGDPTRARRAPLTPGYAAPELLGAGPITTASDVYSLGVILHVLLTGGKPSSGNEGMRLPSQSVMPGNLRRALEGDLDRILLKALEATPERRYPSPAALVEDLARHRAGLPVSARPDGFAYRLGKLLRRNRAATFAGLVLAVAAAALLVQAGLHSRRIASESRKAEALAEILIDLLKTADPTERAPSATPSPSADPDIAFALRAPGGDDDDLVLKRLLSEATPERSLSARVKAALARVYLNRGNVNAALPLMRAVTDERQGEHGPDHPEVASARHELGIALHMQGDFEGAEKELRAALAGRRHAFPGAHPETARSLGDLAMLLKQRGRRQEASALAEEALSMLRRLHAAPHPDLAWGLHVAAEVTPTRVAARAVPLAEEALAMRRLIHGDGHPAVAATLVTLGRARYESGGIDGGEAAFQEAIRLQRSALGEEHPELARAHLFLGDTLARRGRFGEAEASYDRAITLLQKQVGPEHPWLGSLWLRKGRLAEERDPGRAEESYRRAVESLRGRVDESHVYWRNAQLGLGRSLEAKGRREEALRVYTEALRSFESPPAAPPWRMHELRAALARVGTAESRTGAPANRADRTGGAP